MEKNRVKWIVKNTVFKFLRTVPTTCNSKVFLRGSLTMREKQILTSVLKSKKKIRGNHAFCKDN